MSSSGPSPWYFRWTGDVFLSFRGKDTGNGFTGHLYAALSNIGISTFRDSENLQIGDEISPSLFNAIEEAKVAVVVFSKGYAESKWCLDELAKIIECRSANGLIVLPVFYHVAPSDIRNQMGIVGRAFKRNELLFEKHRVWKWRQVMTKAADLSGFHIGKLRSSKAEAVHVKEIVKEVSRIVDSDYLVIADHPVGIKPRLGDILKLIKIESDDDVRVVGIWGMGGIGKTTIAKAIYNEIRHEFEGKSFLSDIKDFWEQRNGHVHLQELLLSDMLRTSKTKILNVEHGKFILKERLHKRRVLLILDDIDDLEQTKALCGNRNWFGSGSRIIITTRDIHVLKYLKADEIYTTRQMSSNESLELFRWYAFKEEKLLDKKFVELSSEAIHYCGGLPVALQVIGSYLFDRNVPQWKSTLEKLRRIPNDQIQKKLRISFDGLNDDLFKDIFLDISCFFIGMDKNEVVQILDGCGFFAVIGLDVLVERCLVTIDKKNKLAMHDLLRDMGREIIHAKSPKEPEARTRLWLLEEVIDVLRNRTGTKAIEGIALKMSEMSDVVSLHAKAFKKIKKLRLLQLTHVELIGEFEYFSKELRWLYWGGFPLRYLPTSLDQGCLVSINLKYSKLKLVWKDPQVLAKLKIIKLSHSHSLIQTPDFSNLPNLEKLVLKDCSTLTTVHYSIGTLSSLVYLNLKGCKSLKKLPRSLYRLKSLKTFILSGCPLIDTLEEDIEQMSSLTILDARDTPIKEVPFSIVKSRSLRFISLCGYEGSAPDLFPSLFWSWMTPRNSSQVVIRSHGEVLSGVSLFSRNSFLSNLSENSSLWLEHRFETHQVRDLAQALNILYSANSHNSEKFCKTLVFHMGSCNRRVSSRKEDFLQGYDCSLCVDSDFATDNNGCFTYKDEGPSVCFVVPSIAGPVLKRVTLSITLSSDLPLMLHDYLVCFINHTKASIQISKLFTFKDATWNQNRKWQNMLSNIESGDQMEVIVDFKLGVTVTKTEVCLVYSMTN